MTKRDQRMPFGQLVYMTFCFIVLAVLCNKIGFGEVLTGLIVIVGTSLGSGFYYLFISKGK